jgi:hypothetical protein
MGPRTAGLALYAALALGAGCITTRATLAPNAQLHQYRTFAFVPETRKALSATPTGAVVRDSIAEQLGKRGIVPTNPGTPPDFWVSYQLVMRQQIAVSDWGGWGWGWWGWGYPGWGPADVYEYTEGTLIVDFIDPQTRQVFWRGTAASVINTPDNPNQRRMEKSVAKMMAKYPVEMVASAPVPTRM